MPKIKRREIDPRKTYLCRVTVHNVHDGRGGKHMKGDEVALPGEIAAFLDERDQVKIVGDVEDA